MRRGGRGVWLARLAAKRSFGSASSPMLTNKLVEVTDSPIQDVKILAMKNPVANVFSMSLMSEIMDSISELCNPDKGICRGIVITSALPGVFSAGLDLHMLHTEFSQDSFISYWSQLQRLYITLNTLPVPLVAAINGYATGVGCIMALASDYRVMAEKDRDIGSFFKIGIDTTKYGFTLPPSLVSVAAHVVGPRRCESLLQLGELVDASTARAIGLVDETVENADEVLIPALEMAEKLSKVASWSYWMVKDKSRKNLVAPLCTQALRSAECWNVYEMLNNPEVRRDLGMYMQGTSL